MKSYSFLEDVAWADLAFKAQGKTLGELFENCALALSSAMVDLKSVQEKRVVEIKLEDVDLSELLYDFLSEIVAAKDADGLLFGQFKVKIEKEDGPYNLEAKAFGEEIDPNTQILGDDVKAITRHHFELRKVRDGFEAQVILDV